MLVDATDFRIPNHGPAFYSHKFKKLGLKYKVAVFIKTGKIVWINGPFQCGRFPDISIFWDALIHELSEGERVEADDGYIGEAPRFIKCPKSIANLEGTERMQSIVRRRQETANKRFKRFGCLNQVFRGDIERHGEYFRACCVISQLAMKNGEPLFPVDYDDK